MENLKEKAVELFRTGYNCAQSVFCSHTEKLGFPKDNALMFSLGFGAGMGRLQQTCGAVTGSFMVLGVYNSKKYTDNNDRKLKCYSMIQEFEDKFIKKFGTISCKALINCNLRTEAGQKEFKEKNMHENICNKCVAGAVEILEEMMI